MVATPQQNETGTRQTSGRQRTSSRRQAKSRNHDNKGGGTGTDEHPPSPEVSAEVGRAETGEGRGNQTAVVSDGVIRSCDVCQHGELDNGFVACGLNLFAGSVVAESVVTRGMAHDCESFEVDFKVGDTVAYSHMPDRPMEILEIIGNRFKVKGLINGATFYVDRALVVKCEEGLAVYTHVHVNAVDNNQLTIIETQDESITSGSTLDSLITNINTLYGQLEEAEQVAVSAAHSALEFAKEMGDKLSQAKTLAGHGNWEQVREQIVSPRTQRPIPSSTAALYMRIADRWNELEANAIPTIREAAEALKKPRNLQPVADLPSEPIVHEKDLVDSLEGLRDDFHQRKVAAEEWATADNSSSISEPSARPLQQGDRLTPKDGGIEGVVVSATDKAVVVNQDDGHNVTSTRLSHAEVAKKFNVARTETEEPDPLKWLDDEFEESIEFVQEYLGPEQVKKSALQVMQAVRDLGGLPVGILAVKGCDRDELLQLQDIINRMLEAA